MPEPGDDTVGRPRRSGARRRNSACSTGDRRRGSCRRGSPSYATPGPAAHPTGRTSPTARSPPPSTPGCGRTSGGALGRGDLERLDVAALLRAQLPWPLGAELEALAPQTWTLPGGRQVAIDYTADRPTAAVRVQDVFGVTEHPLLAGGSVSLTIALLSPADRPIQVTADLPGFWDGSVGGGAQGPRRSLSEAPLARRPGERAAGPSRGPPHRSWGHR